MLAYLVPLAGGLLIGASALAYLLACGRIAGISGLLAGALAPVTADRGGRIAFLAGLLCVGLVAGVLSPASFGSLSGRSPWLLLGAGLLVGIGTRLGNGCTSGHGVCGVGRLSRRSIVATITFILTGALTVYLLREVVA